MITSLTRFNRAIALFDLANSEDPNIDFFENAEHPKELLYSQRMTAWLKKLAPNASEPLLLAARCQHVRRWEIPRKKYPMDRQGYKKWRSTLAIFHAETAGDILRNVGYDKETSERVQALLRKENLKHDPEVQLLEDVVCLVFLESYLADFSKQHEEENLLRIINKTWQKMSEQGREAARTLNIASDVRKILEKAIGK